jgi:hypothetical protein
MFSTLFENAKQHWHLATKVETGVSWEALGIPWDELGRPWGAKSSPEPTFLRESWKLAEPRLSKKLTFLKQNVQLWADLGSTLRLRSKHISSKQQQTQTPKFRRARKQTKCSIATKSSRTLEEAMLASELLGRPS